MGLIPVKQPNANSLLDYIVCLQKKKVYMGIEKNVLDKNPTKLLTGKLHHFLLLQNRVCHCEKPGDVLQAGEALHRGAVDLCKGGPGQALGLQICHAETRDIIKSASECFPTSETEAGGDLQYFHISGYYDRHARALARTKLVKTCVTHHEDAHPIWPTCLVSKTSLSTLQRLAKKDHHCLTRPWPRQFLFLSYGLSGANCSMMTK